MLLNVERLDTLRDEIGADGFEDVVAMFLKESDEVVARLLAGGPGASFDADLHFLKGNAMTLGFDDLVELCRKGAAGAGLDLGALADLYRQSRAALEAGQIRNSASTSSLVMSR